MVTAVFSPSSVHVVEDDATVAGDPPDLSQEGHQRSFRIAGKLRP